MTKGGIWKITCTKNTFNLFPSWIGSFKLLPGDTLEALFFGNLLHKAMKSLEIILILTWDLGDGTGVVSGKSPYELALRVLSCMQKRPKDSYFLPSSQT
jgi:hypothetical protein